MNVIETTPSYYRVQMPDGQVITIARTQGTDALVQSQQNLSGSPQQGLADGGTVQPDYVTAPEFQPEPIDPMAALSTPVPMMNMQPMPPVVGDGGNGSRRVGDMGGPAGAVVDTLAAPPKPWEVALPLVAIPARIAGSVGAAAGAIHGDPATSRAVNKATEWVNTPIGQTPESKPTEAPAPAQEEGGDSFYQELATAFDPLIQQAPAASGPAAPLPSTKDLEEAQGATAADANYYQQQIAGTLAANPPQQAPEQVPVNPKQFYENVGRMFGAENPRTARILGGIATGIVAAFGEIGAALSHRQNLAAQMIQSAIQENIASQQGSQALSRQQWLDQTNYANAIVARKIDELSAMAKGQEGIDRAREAAAKMKLDLALATYQGQAKQGLISADTASKLSDIELVRGAGRDLASILGTFPSGWWANFDDKRLPGDDQNVKRANAAMTILNNRIESMLKTRGKLPGEEGEATRGLEALKITLADTQQTIKTKLQAIANMARQQQAVVRAVGAGTDPSGATLPTPGARPN